MKERHIVLKCYNNPFMQFKLGEDDVFVNAFMSFFNLNNKWKSI
jgi:hypothetical protein